MDHLRVGKVGEDLLEYTAAIVAETRFAVALGLALHHEPYRSSIGHPPEAGESGPAASRSHLNENVDT